MIMSQLLDAATITILSQRLRDLMSHAADEIERLLAENAAIREVADEAELNREGIKYAHAEIARLTVERDALLKEIEEWDMRARMQVIE
jgi:hypothetical protein